MLWGMDRIQNRRVQEGREKDKSVDMRIDLICSEAEREKTSPIWA